MHPDLIIYLQLGAGPKGAYIPVAVYMIKIQPNDLVHVAGRCVCVCVCARVCVYACMCVCLKSRMNSNESLCRDGMKTRWRLQWMY